MFTPAPARWVRRWRLGPFLLLAAVVVLALALTSAFSLGLLAKGAKPAQAAGARRAVGSPSPAAHVMPATSSPAARSTSPAARTTPVVAHTPPAVAVASSWTAIAGYGCPSAHRAAFAEHGRYSRGISGFVEVRTGGWKRQGCNGTFDTMPMSGSGAKPYPGRYALWTFRPIRAAHLRCQVFAFVPDDPSIRHVGGDPAHYLVYEAAARRGRPAGGFAITQVSDRGGWVTGGQFAVPGGALTIALTSVGIDRTRTGPTYAHLAVAQVKISCAR